MMGRNVLLSVLFLISLRDVPPPADVYHLARVIEGEGPKLVCPNMDNLSCMALADRVGQVIMNRLREGWCHTIQRCAAGGFWGAAEVVFPKQWALDAAKRVLRQGPTTGDFYVFSAHDLAVLGLERSDAIYGQQRGIWGLYFYGPEARW